MKKTEENLTLLKSLFCVCFVMTNVLSAKVVNLFGFTLPADVVAYPLTFLITDVIGEIWGKKEAQKAVRVGFICQVVSVVFIYLAIFLPCADYCDIQSSFEAVLMNSYRIVAGSLIAYLISQNIDVWLFHKLKERFADKKWLRNNASTMVSQLADSVIFCTIAFAGIVPNVLSMALSVYAVKVVFALLDTIPFYLLTRKTKEQ